MTDKHVDNAMGRAKQAAGALSGNQRLEDEGRGDRAKSSIKNAIDKAVDALARKK